MGVIRTSRAEHCHGYGGVAICRHVLYDSTAVDDVGSGAPARRDAEKCSSGRRGDPRPASRSAEHEHVVGAAAECSPGGKISRIACEDDRRGGRTATHAEAAINFFVSPIWPRSKPSIARSTPSSCVSFVISRRHCQGQVAADTGLMQWRCSRDTNLRSSCRISSSFARYRLDPEHRSN